MDEVHNGVNDTPSFSDLYSVIQKYLWDEFKDGDKHDEDADIEGFFIKVFLSMSQLRLLLIHTQIMVSNSPMIKMMRTFTRYSLGTI